MNIFRTLHRSILILFAVVVLSIVTLVHFSMTKIVAEQSRFHQAALSPAVKLVIDQVIEPLHVAETLSKSSDLISLMRSTTKDNELDTEEIFSTLQRLENEFNMGFFVALDKQRKQFNSDGTSLDLIEGKVNWYFKYKDTPQRTVGDIGKWEDTQVFIDIKIYDENASFIGFFGVAQSLTNFIDVFAQHKQNYGHDFIFVDPVGNIMLSSDPQLNASKSKFNNVKELSWYLGLLNELGADLDETTADEAMLVNVHNQLVTINEEDVLLAQVNLDLFNWTLLLMSPLQEQQTEISQGFIFSVITVLAVIFVLFLIIYNLLYYFRKDMHNDDVVLPYCKISSDEQIKYIIDSKLITNDAYLVLIQLNDFYQKPLTTESLPNLIAIGTKVSDFLVNTVQQFNNESQFAKVNESQWLVLLQNTNDKKSGRYMENTRHGLATIRTECELQQSLLNFSTCKVKLEEEDTFVSVILRLKPALDNIKANETERSSVV